jgi:orotidine-5'-phosphate decarboxylase
VKTSNSSSSDLQELDSPQQFSVTIGETKGQWTKSLFVAPFLFERVAHQVNKWGTAVMGTNGYSKVGAIVGATSKRSHVFGEYSKRLRSIMPKTFFLIPDFDSDSVTAKDVKKFFDKNGGGCIVNSSHKIITAYMNDNKYEDHNFADAAREAAIKMKDELFT